MPHWEGTLIRKIPLPGGNCVHILARPDGAFQFQERIALPAAGGGQPGYVSGIYISADTAEAAARLKFGL